VKVVYRRKKITVTVTIYTEAGDVYTYTTGEVIAVRIGWSRGRRILEFRSDAASANGSTVQQANPCLVTLVADDLNVAPGVYDMEVTVFDTGGAPRGTKLETLVVRPLTEDSSSSESSSSSSSSLSSSSSSVSSSSTSSVSSSSVSSSSQSSSSSSSVSSSSQSSSSQTLSTSSSGSSSSSTSSMS
jgi:hypothetical protein